MLPKYGFEVRVHFLCAFRLIFHCFCPGVIKRNHTSIFTTPPQRSQQWSNSAFQFRNFCVCKLYFWANLISGGGRSAAPTPMPMPWPAPTASGTRRRSDRRGCCCGTAPAGRWCWRCGALAPAGLSLVDPPPSGFAGLIFDSCFHFFDFLFRNFYVTLIIISVVFS